MADKLIIGLNADFRGVQNGSSSFSFVESGYYDAILKAGAIPMIIPPMEDREDLVEVLSRVDAVMLVGGADLDPRRDNFMLHPTVRLLDDRRETFDRMLAETVAELRIPALGIGLGMQLLNVTQGGTLFLHLPEDFPDGLPHFDLLDANHRHAMTVAPGSLMEKVYGDGDIRVNSMHHMAVDDVAPGFRATAHCPDGVVEAIESVMPDWLVVGTQFHPESRSATALDMRVFHEFFAGVKSRQTQDSVVYAA